MLEKLKVIVSDCERDIATVSTVAEIAELRVKYLGKSEFDCDYIECEIDEICTPFLSYSVANKVECSGEVLATVHEPYFSRTGRHFCGHANTPFKMEAASYPALVKCGNVLYFAHPVFDSYNRYANYIIVLTINFFFVFIV